MGTLKRNNLITMSVLHNYEVNVQIGIQLGNDKPVYKVSGRCVAASICYLAFILCTMTVIFFIVMENTHSQWRFLGDYIRVFYQNKNVTHGPLPCDYCSHPGFWIDATIRT